jgi:hypothetical protein
MTLISNPTPEVLQSLVPKGPWTLDPVNQQLATSALRTVFAMNKAIKAFLDKDVTSVNSLMEIVKEKLGDEKITELQKQPPEIVGPMLRGEVDKLLANKSLSEMGDFSDSATGIRLVGEYYAASHKGEGMQSIMALMAMKQHVESLREAMVAIVHMAVASSILAKHPNIRFDVNHHFEWSLKIDETNPDNLMVNIVRYGYEPRPKDEEKTEEEDGAQATDRTVSMN